MAESRNPRLPRVLLLSDTPAQQSKTAAILLNQLSLIWKFEFIAGKHDTQIEAAVIFSTPDIENNSSNAFMLPEPVWQLGTVDRPELLVIIENEIFFKRGMGHFGFNALTALRIDDYPLTSEKYLKSGCRAHDRRIMQEIKNIMKACSGKALPEFMIASHILLPSGTLTSVAEIVPGSVHLLRELYSRKFININAHGRSHVDEAAFLQNGSIIPGEFSRLTDDETRTHIEDSISFIKEAFSKTAVGFVPACWSYNNSNTKKLAARYFSYLADSNQRLERGEAEPFGAIMDTGTVHIPETIRATSPSLDLASPELWDTYFKTGIPAHFMAHGPYFMDPIFWLIKLLRKQAPAASCLLIMAGAICFYVLNLSSFLVLLAALSLAGLTGWFNRHAVAAIMRRFLELLPVVKRKTLGEVVKVASGCSARWVYLEQLADIAKAYGQLEPVYSGINDTGHWVKFIAHTPIPEGIAYFAPSRVLSASLDGHPLTGLKANRIDFGRIPEGEHILVYSIS